MQEHVELEVALEIIMARIAQKISDLKGEISEKQKEQREIELEEMMKMQEEAYQGNRKVIQAILEKKEETK